MLRWFNRYSKWVMVSIMALLMVAFTIQPVISMFNPDPRKATAATFADGTKITNGELAIAENTVSLLPRLDYLYSTRLLQSVMGEDGEGLMRAMNLGLLDPQTFGPRMVFRPLYETWDPTDEEAERWLMLQHDAESLGIHASAGEVSQFLELVFGSDNWTYDDEAKNRATAERAMRQPAGVVRDLARQLLVAQKYAEEMNGRSYESDYLARATGLTSARLSEPLRRRLVIDSNATANGRYAVIDASRVADLVEPPTAQRVQRTFEQYREDLPDAQGRFGYRYPDRFRVEFLMVSPAQVASQVDEPTPVEVTAYYDDNREAFGELSEYDARGLIIDAIKRERAQALAQRIADRALDILDRRLAATDGVQQNGRMYDLPDGFAPMPLDAVADQLNDEFGVRPLVSDETQADAWVTAQDVVLQPMLSGLEYRAQLDQRGYPLGQYLMSVREMSPDPSNPLVSLGGQVGVALKRLVAMRGVQPDGSGGVPDRFAVVRVIEASPSHAPETLSEVEDRVAADARRDLAYERLLAERDAWAARLEAEGLEAVADAESAVVNDLTVPRRQVGDRALVVPMVPGVGQDEAFIASVFEAAAGATPEAPGRGVVALGDARALALFEVDGVTGVPRSLYDARASVALYVEGSVASGVPSADPLSEVVLRERTGWELKDARRRGDEAGMAAGDGDEVDGDAAAE